MKVHICDSCKTIVEDPYKCNYREYFIGCNFDLGTVFPWPMKRNAKIELCKDCYSNLKKLNDAGT